MTPPTLRAMQLLRRIRRCLVASLLAVAPAPLAAQYLGHEVTPDNGQASPSNNRVEFTIANFKEVTDTWWDTFDLTCDLDGSADYCDSPTWISIERGTSAGVWVSYTASGELYLRATDPEWGYGLTEYGWYDVTFVEPNPATVSVTPDGAQITVAASTNLSYTFDVSNTSQSAGTFNLAVQCSVLTDCPSTLPAVTLAAFQGTTVNVGYTSASAGNFGTIKLRATNAAHPATRDSGTVTVYSNFGTPPPGGGGDSTSWVAITPGRVIVGTTTVAITVTWCGYPPVTNNFDIGTKVITANGVDVTASFDHQPHQQAACNFEGPVSDEEFYTSTGTITVSPETGPVTIDADVSNQWGYHWMDSETFYPPVPRRGVTVIAEQQFVTATPSVERSERFTVSNTGNASDTIPLAVSGCANGAVATSCSLSPAGPLVLGAGESAAVTATYTTSETVGSTGVIWLKATSDGLIDSSWTDVTVAAAQSVGVTIAGMAPGLNDVVPRGACVTVALTDDAASECGDLRLVHGVAPVRTMGTVRAPTLLYNSQHARPKPLVMADIRLSAGVALPPNVTACIKVSGVNRGCGTWPGSNWDAPGNTRRIVVAGDDGGWNSGAVDYTLEVRASNENQGPYTASGRLLVVNRTGSAFGAGWWMAGLEQLVVLSPTELVWIGGDGSARRYVKSAEAWRAPNFAALDSILAAGTGYVRRTAEHARVYFNAGGQHDSTVNMLGHVTKFEYAGGLLTSIRVPKPAGGTLDYTLAYASGLLDSVAAPGGRATRVFRTAARVDSIRDPDGQRIRFTSGTGLNQYVVTERKNRRGHTTSFGYDGANRVSQATRPLGNITVLAAAETRGLSAAVSVDAGFTEIDGPRTDVADLTRFWINGYGAPLRSRNALGQETRVVYNAIWPGLADSVTGPNRLASRAYYNSARGLPDSVKVFNPLGTGSNAVSRYQWHPSLNQITSVRSPTSVNAWLVDSISYNPDGTKAWDQRGTSATRVDYTYTADKLPETLTLPGSVFSFAYGSLGNVRKEQSALGFLTLRYEDNAGRDTLVITPRGTAGEATDSTQVTVTGVRQLTAYDAMSRDTMTMTIGPQVTLPPPNSRVVPSDTIRVQSTYDEEGNRRSVTRSYTRKLDATHGGLYNMFPSEWVYDSLNRVVQQEHASSGRTMLTLDPAGNATLTRTPRQKDITATYDALNRIKQRIVPQATFAGSLCNYPLPASGSCGYTFPIIEGPTLCVAVDTARFTYTAAGALRSAENGWAKVRRAYAPNGLITHDTLITRRYETEAPGPCGGGDKHALAESSRGSDWVGHRYALQHEYDLGGRRTALHHPDQLDPCSGGRCVQSYGYNATTGTLDTLTHPAPEGGSLTTRFEYDAQLRLQTTYHPGGVSITRDYDADGRAYARSGALTQDLLTFDATGRVVGGTVQSPSGVLTLTLGYSGLGALQYADGPTPGVFYEEYKTDALGNRLWVRDPEMIDGIDRTRYHTIASESGQLTASSLGTATCSPAGATMPSCHPPWYWNEYGQSHDQSGNVEATWGVDTRGTSSSNAEQVPEESRSYYAADEKLSYHNRHLGWSTPGEGTGVFEEYRYDALGRRVYMRSRRPSACAYPCEAYVQRTVWDGDQVLYEIRSSSDTGATPVYMNREGAVAPWDDGNLFGIIAYAHGPGIDQPVGMLKEYAGSSGGSNTWSYVTPHANWKGEWSYGTFSDGTYCQATGQACPTWPGFRQSMDGAATGNEPPTYTVWWGNIIRGQADASGLQYLRNRYYDPKTGRFTQQDPIGLAGGLNLYGYAGGDPVNFSDPFGLSQCPQGYYPSGDVCLNQAAIFAMVVTGPAGRWRSGVQALRLAVAGRLHARTLNAIRSQHQNILTELSKHNHLQAARLERTGRLITGFDHPHELTDFANGLRHSAIKLKELLGNPNLSDENRAVATELLSRTSKLLDEIKFAMRQ